MDFETRLAALERSARRWRVATVSLAGVLVVGLFVGADTVSTKERLGVAASLQGDGTFENLAAKRFGLIDDEGKVFFSVGRDDDGYAVMVMQSDKGKTIFMGGESAIHGTDKNGKAWKISASTP